ncbi:DUF6391 domain-containing protein [Spirulina sp. 06S082]|uniref:DUF6391 domain-containing protein n=1 Tax=Spirulina sp. 06S082 TaxID=3110248 RepID=UPI002B21CA61|nr:DUF6391 domain-containing protein [Spirulina sp. 06S082]MEA5472214.1 DUF6391 domain-containing protein [Spirulina sp. 06S082]
MTQAATANSGEFFNFEPAVPYPTQDSDLLKALSFIPSLQEVLLLRQVHALEHATVWVLSEMMDSASPSSFNANQRDDNTLGGLSTEKGFYLYGTVNLDNLRQAVRQALDRLQGGEWNLAVHPRCGTNVSVNILLGMGLAAGASFLLPRNPLEQILGVGLAAVVANQIAPDLGELAQKYITTSIPFNLVVDEIVQTADFWGRSSHFVQVRWQD